MEIKQTHINHLVKTLASQLRELDDIKDCWGKGMLISMVCKAASKTVVEIEKIGVDYDRAYDMAYALNESMAS